jgi:hypothetical protein
LSLRRRREQSVQKTAQGASKLFYCSRNIFRMIKPRRMRWEWHVARIGARRVFGWESEGKRITRRR